MWEIFSKKLLCLGLAECWRSRHCLYFTGEHSEPQAAQATFGSLDSSSLPRDLSRACDCSSFPCMSSLRVSTMSFLEVCWLPGSDAHGARDCKVNKRGVESAEYSVSGHLLLSPLPPFFCPEATDLLRRLLLEALDPGCSFVSYPSLLGNSMEWDYLGKKTTSNEVKSFCDFFSAHSL